MNSKPASNAVFTGFWIDWDRGKYQGATLTLPDTKAAPLLVILAILVTFAANRSWFICRFLLHSIQSREKQVILRNSETAGGASLSFLEYWLENGIRRLRWSLKGASLGLFVIGHWIAFIALGVLVSQIVIGKTVVSKSLPTCGQWFPKNDTGREKYDTWHELLLNQTLNAENYVRSCYPQGVAQGLLDCNTFVSKSIPFQTEDNVACPFSESTCWKGKDSAFAMDSGNITLSQLGLNTKYGQSISLQRRTTCAVVDAKRFRTQIRTKDDLPYLTENEAIVYYSFTIDSKTKRNDSWLFRSDGFNMNYELSALFLANKPEDLSSPLRPKAQELAGVSLILLRGDGIHFLEQQDDPFFSVHTEVIFTNGTGNMPRGQILYEMDNFLNIIACEEKFRFCSSTTEKCTDWRGLKMGDRYEVPILDTLLGSSISMTNTSEISNLLDSTTLLRNVIPDTNLPASIQERGAAAALQAARYLKWNQQMRLQPEQWKVELKYWFSMALAKTQIEVFNSIERPADMDSSRVFNTWEKGIDQNSTSLMGLCGRVKFKDPSHTSLSTLGIAIVIGFSGLLTLASLMGALLPIMKWTKKWKFVEKWQRDEVLSLLAATNHRAVSGSVPVESI